MREATGSYRTYSIPARAVKDLPLGRTHDDYDDDDDDDDEMAIAKVSS